MAGTDLEQQPIHLGLGATAEVEPPFTGDMAWYEAYAARHATDGAEGRLVSLHGFSEPWGMWEMHPAGAEVVLCVAGSLTLHLEAGDGAVETTTLAPQQYVVIPPGTWHTADVAGEATALFITAGQGTQHRPR